MKHQTLVKLTGGHIFAFSQENGLRCKAGEKEQILLEQMGEDYDILVDENNQIHIISGDIAGSLLYLQYDGDAWQKEVILQSRAQNGGPRQMRIFKVGNFVNVFYRLQYEDKNLLTHQILDRNPEVVDSILQDVFDISIYQEQKIFAFYREEKTKKICYRRYDWSQKHWNEKKQTEMSDVSFIKVLCVGDTFHMIYRVKSKLFYQKWETQDGIELTMAEGPVFITDDMQMRDCTLLFTEHALYILWDGENGPCMTQSPDEGKTFSISRKLPYARQTGVYHLCECLQNPIKSTTFGYESGGKLHLLAREKFLQPAEVTQEVAYVSPTRDVEQFAGVEQRQEENRLEIELNKIKIRVSMLEKQMGVLLAYENAAVPKENHT